MYSRFHLNKMRIRFSMTIKIFKFFLSILITNFYKCYAIITISYFIMFNKQKKYGNVCPNTKSKKD